MTDIPEGLKTLFDKLVAWEVDWSYAQPETSYQPGDDRERVVNLRQADTISSLRKNPGGPLDMFPKHAVALDLDVPSYLVPSSTPGHNHLYIDVEVNHDDYMNLLRVLADCGIIEKGYAEVSRNRGHSDLRLPWVKKGES